MGDQLGSCLPARCRTPDPRPTASMATARKQPSPLPTRGSQSNSKSSPARALTTFLLLSASNVMAQQCVSLAGSTACPAFASASISNADSLTGLFPFMAGVTNREQFDSSLAEYIRGNYAESKYASPNQLGCSNVDLSNTTDLYARYTTTVICNAIVQNSITFCNSAETPPPLCADSCAVYAISEQEITASTQLCGTPGPNALSQLRADFTNCALPANSLNGGRCLKASDNEPSDCGFSNNLSGLCSFCRSSTANDTDSCCVTANTESRCENVKLPTFGSMAPLFTTTVQPGPSETGSASPPGPDTGSGLSSGAIAGIIVGSILGALLLLALIIVGCILLRRRRSSKAGSIFNQPSPPRQGSPKEMSFANDGPRSPSIVPPGRVARMAALEDGFASSRPRSSRPASSKKSSPDRQRIAAAGGLPRRNGSLSSQSALNIGDDPGSPQTSSGFGDQFSSPEGVTSGQSEQLAFFKDYYSQDEIHPHDTVATLWAYQPRANDEFELERGDMLKIVGIWDDGWATGVKLTERSEEWERRRQEQRDSGVSNTGARTSPIVSTGEIKAFPLVCVCLPQHWRKTIDGDTTGDASGHGGIAPPRSSSP